MVKSAPVTKIAEYTLEALLLDDMNCRVCVRYSPLI